MTTRDSIRSALAILIISFVLFVVTCWIPILIDYKVGEVRIYLLITWVFYALIHTSECRISFSDVYVLMSLGLILGYLMLGAFIYICSVMLSRKIKAIRLKR